MSDISIDLTDKIVSKLKKLRKTRPHFLLIIDEIDSLSKTQSSTLVFKNFLKSIYLN